MILIAALDSVKAREWHALLSPLHKLYELDIHDFRALELCLKKVKFDLIVLDLDILGQSGVHEISTLKELQPQAHFVIMTKDPQSREEISAILFGAKAYCSFDMSPDIFVKMINCVLANELWVDRKFVSRLLAELEDITKVKHAEAKRLNKGVSSMTPRENEIAQLVATGASNRRIADLLGISERTVKAHLGVIFRKIGITDRLQLALYMNRHQQLSSIWRGNKINPNIPTNKDH